MHRQAGYSITLDLTTKSEREAELHVDGCRASIAIDSAKVLVEDVVAATPDEALVKARSVAPKLLDILCAICEHCLRLYEEDPATSEMDSVRSALLAAANGTKTLVTADTTVILGTLRCTDPISDSWKLGVLPFKHLPAMASFRSAMLTGNAFHKFRDFYLAIENAAPRLASARTCLLELEGALRCVYAARLRQLVNAATQSGVSCTEQDAARKVAKCLWVTHRLKLFHAHKEPAIVVSDPKDRARVERVLPLAEHVARDLIRAAAAKP